MNRFLVLVVFLLLISGLATTQPCFPNGIHFQTQSQIDNFQVNYPTCHEIEGDLIIKSNSYEISNLNGLSVLTKIGGDLTINSNANLENLFGLNNIISIGGDLTIHNNYFLSSISALENLDPDSIINLTITANPSLSACEAQSLCDYLSDPKGIVIIYDNASGCNYPSEIASSCIINLPCLPYGNYYFFNQQKIDNFQTNFPNCNEIEGRVEISGSNILNLLGLSVIESIQGDLVITYTDSLEYLTGLDSLNLIGGQLWISQNNNLINLSALNNLVFVGENLTIQSNPSLVSLIHFNNPPEIVGGLLIFNANLITNLNGFENISSVGGLNISSNDNLISLEGLENLTSITGSIHIYSNDNLVTIMQLNQVNTTIYNLKIVGNNRLQNLSGLDNISTISRDLSISSNDSLNNLTALYNLTSIGDKLNIRYNDVLTSLEGIDNINAGTIWGLGITNNPLLSYCEVQSVCGYITNPNSSVTIHDNGIGCNSKGEVELACITDVTNNQQEKPIFFYPNPAQKKITILNEQGIMIKRINIYNQLGNKVLSHVYTNNSIDISNLNQGIYIIEFCSKKIIIREKLLITK